MKTLLMVAITLALAGCAHPPQRPVAEECKAYGFTPGTEGFCYCQMYVANARMSREGSMTCKDAAGGGKLLLKTPQRTELIRL